MGDVNLIFAGDEEFSPGIVGLVAGRLTEEFYRPAVILEFGAEVSRASCRSIPEFNITHALDECADLLIRHGGHAMAAGFTVRQQQSRRFAPCARTKSDAVAGRSGAAASSAGRYGN